MAKDSPKAGPVVEVDFAAQLLARPGHRLAPGAVAELLVPGLEPVEGGGEEPGDRGAISRWSKSPLACSTIHSHSSSSTIARRSSSSTRAARASMKIARVRPKSRQKLQRVPSPIEWIRWAQGKSSSSRLLVAADRLVELVLGQLARREVANVLVDPVAGDAADHAPVPPGLCCISSSQSREMFQSSLMSWSSQSIETETRRRASGSAAPPSSRGRARCTPRSRSPRRRGAFRCRAAS